jgi:hypothetical protein
MRRWDDFNAKAPVFIGKKSPGLIGIIRLNGYPE